MVIPFVTGVGETIRALKATKYVAEEGMEGAIDIYHHLNRINEGTNMEVHHIVEKRFSPQLNYGKTGSSMPSIALEKDVHRGYTNDWRKVLPYGKTRKSREIIQAVIKVYGNNPRMFGAAIFTITRG